MREHKVHLEDPKGGKVELKTHEIDEKDCQHEIILLINQIVNGTYQFVFVIEHKQEETSNDKYVIKNKTYFFVQKTTK